jgi:hypothetical protein
MSRSTVRLRIQARRRALLPTLRPGGADVLAQLVHQGAEGGVEGGVEGARARQRHGAFGDDPAGPGAHHQDTVGEVDRLANIVGHEDHGRAAREPYLLQRIPQLLARESVERAEGLVEHQERRLVHERPADRGALLHAARELPGMAILEALEADEGEKIPGACLVGGALAAQARAVRLHDLEREHDVCEGRAPGQRRGVLERHADAAQRTAHVLPADRHPSAGHGPQARDGLHQGRLAAARRPDDGQELPLADAQRRLIEREGTIVLAAVPQRHVVKTNEVDHHPSAADKLVRPGWRPLPNC